MKETELKTKDEVVIVDQKQVEKKRELIGSIRPNQGHQCFELNTETGEIKLATYKQININFEAAMLSDRASTRKVIDVKEKCLYATALNKKNAIKRFKKMISSK
jgi:hypothetical protein